MKYLDFHQHYGMVEYLGSKVDERGDANEIYENVLIQKCKKLDMVVAVNGCAVYIDKKIGLIVMEENDKVEKFFKKYPEYIIGVGYVDLDYDKPSYIDSLYNRGFKAIKTIWPAERYDSKKYFEFYSKCQFYKMPILFHTGVIDSCGYSGKEGVCSFNMNPLFLEMVGVLFPKLQIVGAHLGYGWTEAACVMAYATTYEGANNNIKFDLSTPHEYRERISKFIKRDIPIDCLVWGFDLVPSEYEKGIDHWNKIFDDMNLSREEKEKFFYKNACDILGIDY